MAAQPELFNLSWHAHSSVARYDLSKREHAAAPFHDNVIDTRINVPAVVLFPALLTPTLHVRGTHGGMIELLVAAAKTPELLPEHVNLCLKITTGLDGKAPGARRRLFAQPKGKIVVKRVDPIDSRVETNTVFKGVLHPSVANWLPKALDGYWAIQLHESCLDRMDADASDVEEPDTRDYQDLLIHRQLLNLNGPALDGVGGCGTHEFGLGPDGLQYFSVNRERPIVSYHPLYVYPAGELRELTLGHVCDIHLNARQKLLKHSPARVIDFASPSPADTHAGRRDSPPIGTLMNDFERAFASTLAQLEGKGADVLLVTGDVIEHIDNAFPYRDGFVHANVTSASAADVWDMVDVGNGYDRRYQACVDLIAFFTHMRDFCSRAGRPVFAVAGNHDAYGRSRLYGMSPRVLSLNANPGIPSDHNLTFYEALLAFGPTWWMVTGLMFGTKHFAWFHAMLTPFADFAVELPTVRLVGLGWGEDEEVMSLAGSGGQGVAHLGRAEEAVTSSQLSLLWAGARPSKKTVLMSHFTLVSYGGATPLGDAPATKRIDVLGPGVARKGDPFSDHDNGTFEKNRGPLYSAVANAAHTSCVLSGHAHRKGLYFLGAWDGEGYATDGYGLRAPRNLTDFAGRQGRAPIIVSDSAGPLPRYNQNGEWGGHGSDRPGATLVQVGEDGRVTRVETVRSTHPEGKPRLSVAVDLNHVMRGHVFQKITVRPFQRARASEGPHAIEIAYHRFFPPQIAQGMDVVLYGLWTGVAPWTRIPLRRSKVAGTIITYDVPEAQSAAFFTWLLYGSRSGRFMSFGFASAGGLEDIYEHETRWNLEVDTSASWWNGFLPGGQAYDIIPFGEGVGNGDFSNWLTTKEEPNFTWRRVQFPAYRRR